VGAAALALAGIWNKPHHTAAARAAHHPIFFCEMRALRTARIYLTKSVQKVISQKPVPAQTCSHIHHYYKYKKKLADLCGK